MVKYMKTFDFSINSVLEEHIMKKRILSIILSIVMLVGLLPTTALAVATTADPVKTWNIGAPESGYTATDAVVAKLYTHATDNT